MNARTEKPLASSVEIAQTSAERRRGLLGRDSLPAGSALVITRCNAVHTIGMRFAIDVAFVDSSGRVRKIVQNLAPWRMAAALFASAVIEFPAGALSDGALAAGDRVYINAEQGQEGRERQDGRDRREGQERSRGFLSRATVAPKWAAVASQNSRTSG